MKRKAILAAPAFGGGRGGGHLVRSAALVRELRALGREAYIFIPGRKKPAAPASPAPLPEKPAASFPVLPGDPDPAWILGTEKELARRSWEWIVLDRFRTTAEEFKRWAALGPVIGLDEGGPARENFDFLIDLLPGLPGIHPANITAPYLLPLPENRRKTAFSFQGPDSSGGENPAGGPSVNILVSFGAEDSAGLTAPAALALVPPGNRSRVTVSALFGALNKSPAQSRENLEQAGVRVRAAVPNLGELLADYDMVITHFGITAFQALRAGVSVVLVSPTPCHERLALEAGFISAGTGPAACRKLRTLIYELGVGSEELGVVNGSTTPPFSPPASKTPHSALLGSNFFRDINIRCRELARRYLLDDSNGSNEGQPRSLGGLIGQFEPILPSGCPVCGRNDRLEDPVLGRFPERTYRRCRRCSLVYLERAAPPPVEYEAGYFFDSYRKQYGKTYLEDFPNLKKTGTARLRRIRRMLPKQGDGSRLSPERLLDIGCAFGPFLAAAAEAGFEPAGIDPAAEAVAYVRDKLRIPASRGFFPDQPRGELSRGQGFSVVTLWYVIEHLRDPRKALAEIHRLLRPGGVLACSTPSFSGISGRKSPVEFLRASPDDHWTVWDPRRVSRILDRFGFEVRKTVITGHHPERFPVIGGLLKGKRGPLYRFCYRISQILGWGDTFEVYAVKRAGA
ncbi:MAG: class I SAM-dependent methyltransferase [Treponema sp.]|jgi:SAM-dependent methyltransferase/spore coat polysaccharide biosynthesis predicted glycosyltransferase SpsG|nr:class I SAM-dependent methyltransferase [Treponema sp.]